MQIELLLPISFILKLSTFEIIANWSNCRQMVSLYTCSKLCTVFFVAGVVVGYTLKKRVRSWASKLLKRLKDD